VAQSQPHTKTHQDSRSWYAVKHAVCLSPNDSQTSSSHGARKADTPHAWRHDKINTMICNASKTFSVTAYHSRGIFLSMLPFALIAFSTLLLKLKLLWLPVVFARCRALGLEIRVVEKITARSTLYRVQLETALCTAEQALIHTIIRDATVTQVMMSELLPKSQRRKSTYNLTILLTACLTISTVVACCCYKHGKMVMITMINDLTKASTDCTLQVYKQNIAFIHVLIAFKLKVACWFRII
jgi:hypothetical protein